MKLKTPLERELSNGERHRYQIGLSKGEYAGLLVEQRGIDVLVRLSGADAKLIAEFDSEARAKGEERVELVAEVEGNYTLEIEPRYKTLPAGHYQIQLTELRTSTPRDRALYEARSLHAESVRLQASAKYDDSQSYIERAVGIFEKELGIDHPDTLGAIHTRAKVYEIKGEFEKAEQLNQRVLKMREARLDPLHPDIAASLNNLGNVYYLTENFIQALSIYQRVLEIREKALGADHPTVAPILTNIGNTYLKIGDHVKAVDVYTRSLTIQEKVYGPESANAGVLVSRLAAIATEAGDYPKAEPMFQRAISIMEKSFGSDNIRLADHINNFAAMYIKKGESDKGIALFSRALALQEKVLGPNHPHTISTIHNLGSSYRFKGDYVKAEELYKRALELREKTMGAEHPSVARSLSSLAGLYELKGDASQAIAMHERSTRIIERQIDLTVVIGSERQKLAFLDYLPEQLNQVVSMNLRFGTAAPAVSDLAATLILQRKGRALDALIESLVALRQRLNSEDRILIDSLNDMNAQLATLVLNGPQKASLVEHQQNIKSLEERREKLENEVSRRSAGFFQESKPITLASVRSAIPSNAALIEFAIYSPLDLKRGYDERLGKPRYIAYVIRKDGDVQWKDLGEEESIDASLIAFRQALRDPKRSDARQLARAIDQRVMEPLRALIGDADHLLVSADGALNLIPFEALVDERNRYLVELYSFSYLTSGRDLLRLNVERKSFGNPLVMVAPSFGEPERTPDAKPEMPARQRLPVAQARRSVTTGSDLTDVYFAPLSATEQEGQAIKTLFPEAVLMTGTRATESALKQASAPRILHIATHGFFLTDAPSAKGATSDSATDSNHRIENPLLRSGLALAGANSLRRSSEDGILTALEASGLNLWGTKLVVLSACDTGLGEVKNGEGVYGLRRAFVLAGTETVVMSLWPVSDYVTREFMVSYYKGLKQGQGRGDSLRGAQLDMLKRKERQHPFYWASFIQSGEWASLEGTR